MPLIFTGSRATWASLSQLHEVASWGFTQKFPCNHCVTFGGSLTVEEDSTALYSSCTLHESKARWHSQVLLPCWAGAWPWYTPSRVLVLLPFRSRGLLGPFPFISWKLNWAGFYPACPSLHWALLNLSLWAEHLAPALTCLLLFPSSSFLL